MKSIRNKLSLATCSLLTTGNASAEAIENAWEVDSSYLHYSEVDRVTVNKLVGYAKGYVSTKDTASIKVVFDAMSGATPTGAVKNSVPSFTGASGGTGITPTGESAALADFDDARAAVSVDWQHEHTRTLSVSYNGAFSVENDWRSFSLAATANKENSSRSSRWTFGLAGTYDEIFRVNGNNTPEPMSRVADQRFLGKGDRFTTDFIAGWTRVINRRTIGQINLAYGLANGYMTDPYKVFSVVDAPNGVEWDQYFEGRPDSRARWSITANLNHTTFPANNGIHLSYRYYSDDWDVKSHTLDYAHRFTFANADYLEPRIRLYSQSKASFYQNEFVDPNVGGTPNLPQFLSADYRLDDMVSGTIALTYGVRFGRDADLRTRLGYIHQEFENSEFSENKAVIFNISYGKRF